MDRALAFLSHSVPFQHGLLRTKNDCSRNALDQQLCAEGSVERHNMQPVRILGRLYEGNSPNVDPQT
jgi:hypothetical protein